MGQCRRRRRERPARSRPWPCRRRREKQQRRKCARAEFAWSSSCVSSCAGCLKEKDTPLGGRLQLPPTIFIAGIEKRRSRTRNRRAFARELCGHDGLRGDILAASLARERVLKRACPRLLFSARCKSTPAETFFSARAYQTGGCGVVRDVEKNETVPQGLKP